MPADPRNYPPGWAAFTLLIRARAGDRCECEGECGLHHERRCDERGGQPAKWARGRVVLTTAHRNAPGGPCQCEPLCMEPEHVASMCQRCHLRYDAPRHTASAARSRRRKATQAGQTTLPGTEP